MDRAVDFADALRREAGLGEVAVDVAGEHEGVVPHCFGDAAQQGEAGVRGSGAVEGEAVAVEAPGQARVAAEGVGVGDRLEADAGLAERRIDGPEAARPAEIGEPGVDAHAGARADQQAVGSA